MPTFTTTTKHALRWLTGSNLVSDVDAGFQALAEDLDPKLTPFSAGLIGSRPTSTSGSPGKAGRQYYATDTGELFLDLGTSWLPIRLARPVVTSLPSSPYDGQEVSFLADATAGVVWQLKYRQAAPAPYRWEFIGGTPLTAEVATSQTTSNTSYVDLATVGPSIFVPLAGDYIIEYGAAMMHNANGGGAYMSIIPGTGVAVDADAARFVQPGTAADAQASVSRLRKKTAVPASSAIVAQYRTSGTQATFFDRWLRVIPARVG